jgi:hypothetical protein
MTHQKQLRGYRRIECEEIIGILDKMLSGELDAQTVELIKKAKQSMRRLKKKYSN